MRFNDPRTACRPRPPRRIRSGNATLTLAYSPEKAALIKELAAKFNAEKQRTADRQLMQIALVELSSEEMVNQALGRRDRVSGADARLFPVAGPAQPPLGADPGRWSPAPSHRG